MAECSDTNDKDLFPVFIIGSPRSGTSVLHWALCEHEMLWGSEESELLLPFTGHIEVLHQSRMVSLGYSSD